MDKSLSLLLLSLSSLDDHELLLSLPLSLLGFEPCDSLLLESDPLELSVSDISLLLEVGITLLDELAMLAFSDSIEA